MGRAPLVLVAATLAGISTLAAEALWLRSLGRGVGVTPEALALVGGLLLAGLGVGAAVGARSAPRSDRPARAGGRCLLLAGTLVALSPLYLVLVPGLNVGLLSALGLDGAAELVSVFLLTAPLVLPPTVLVGTAFPYLVRARVLDLRRAASNTGWLYGLQAGGALLGVIGVLIALPQVGEATALHLAGACALLAALLLLVSDRPLPHGSGPPSRAEPGRSLGGGPVGPTLFAAGFAALVSQLAWLRLLQPLVGAHLWSFALLLGPVLVGVALGAVVSGGVADRLRRAGAALAAVLVAGGVLTILSLPLAGGLPLRLVGSAGAGDAGRVVGLTWNVLLVCGPAMLAFGAALPLAVRVDADLTGSSSGAAGRIVAWSTLGALCGGVLAGVLLLPALGAERSLVIAGAVAMAAAGVLRLRSTTAQPVVVAALHVAPLAVLLWPGLLGHCLQSGPTLVEFVGARKPVPPGLALADREDLRLYASWFVGRRAHAPADASGAPLPVFDGRFGRVHLIEEPDGFVALRRGALREAVFHLDDPSRPAAAETALGLLPGLIHAAPTRAAVLGHGAGWAADALLALGVERLDVVEADGAVLAAARRYRGRERLPAEHDPRARLVPGDGRLLLRRAARRPPAQRYCLIASQPRHAWSAASAHLFTQEAYETARGALREDGVMAQSLDLFDLSPALLRQALGAFRAVFDFVWVYRFPGELILIGSSRPLVLHAEHRWEAQLGGDGACSRLARAAGFASPGALWKHFALDVAGLERVLGADPGSLHDDRPQLDSEMAWRRVTGAAPRSAEHILFEGFPPDVGAVLPDATRRERWIAEAVRGWLADGHPDEAEQWSRRIRWGGSADAKAVQGLAALASGQLDRGADLLARATAQAPDRGDLAAHWIDALGRQLAAGAAADPLLARIEAVVARRPSDGGVLAAAAGAYRSVARVAEARALFERAMAATDPPAPPGTGIRLARLLLSGAQDPASEKRAAALLARDPATFERVDALDLYLRLTSQSGDEARATELEGALRTLEQVQGLALWRKAAGHLARHEFEDALREARECRLTWLLHGAAWELEGLALLAAAGARPEAVDASEAVDLFAEGIGRAEDPGAATGRAVRMLRWYALAPASLHAALADKSP